MRRLLAVFGLIVTSEVHLSACDAGREDVVPDGPRIHHVLSTGQSNAVGFAATDVLSDTAARGSLMFDTGVFTATGCDADGCTSLEKPRALVPLVEGDRYFDYPTETMSSGLAAAIARHSGVTVLASVHGRSGNSYACLRKAGCAFLASKGCTSAFDDGLAQVDAAKVLTARIGRAYRVGAVTVVHGESDHYAPSYPLDPTEPGAPRVSTYADALLEWQRDYDASIRARTGQAEVVPILVSQMSNWNDRPNSEIPAAQLEAHVRSAGRVVLVGPTYMLPYAGDCIHFTSHGERRLGEYFAKAYARTVVDGGRWEPVRPTAARPQGSTIVVDFTVPVPPLVLDTSRVADPGNAGFEVVDTAGSPVTVERVAVSGATQVTLTLSTPAQATQRVRYAWTAEPRTCPGPETGPRGNLRDSDETPSDHGYDLHNWAVHFDLEVR